MELDFLKGVPVQMVSSLAQRALMVSSLPISRSDVYYEGKPRTYTTLASS